MLAGWLAGCLSVSPFSSHSNLATHSPSILYSITFSSFAHIFHFLFLLSCLLFSTSYFLVFLPRRHLHSLTPSSLVSFLRLRFHFTSSLLLASSFLFFTHSPSSLASFSSFYLCFHFYSSCISSSFILHFSFFCSYSHAHTLSILACYLLPAFVFIATCLPLPSVSRPSFASHSSSFINIHTILSCFNYLPPIGFIFISLPHSSCLCSSFTYCSYIYPHPRLLHFLFIHFLHFLPSLLFHFPHSS